MDGIQLKTTSSKTFVDAPTVGTKPPSPPLTKISGIDISGFFNGENLLLDEIDSLMALKILDYLISYLIKVAESKQDEKDGPESVGMMKDDSVGSVDEERDAEDTPISPKKRQYSDAHDKYLLAGGNFDDKPNGDHKRPKTQESKLVGRFLLKSVPELTPTQYLERINRYCGFSTAVYLTCCHYIYKLILQLELLKLTRHNVHRLIIAGLRVSCKTLEDINHTQQFVARIGGVKLDDLTLLEISFLFLLDFDCQSNAALLTTLVGNVKNIFRSEMTQS